MLDKPVYKPINASACLEKYEAGVVGAWS